jgi:hypothetical protein
MWHELYGPYAYLAGASGTVTVPSSAIVTKIIVHSSAGGSMTIFGGASITLPAATAAGPPWVFDFMHDNVRPHGSGASAQIVFTTTESYYIEYISPLGS